MDIQDFECLLGIFLLFRSVKNQQQLIYELYRVKESKVLSSASKVNPNIQLHSRTHKS